MNSPALYRLWCCHIDLRRPRTEFRLTSALMAHVVAQPCYDCKHTDCVVVCPVECFYEGYRMLYIHPEECIDCEACVPECPEEAIYHEDRLPADWMPFRDLNATMARQSPVATSAR